MKYIIFAIFVLGIFLPSTSSHQVPFYRTDYTYFEAFDAFYKLRGGGEVDVTGASWINAFNACAEEGATLFYPKAQGEWTLVKNLTDTGVSNVTDIFIGIHDEYKLGEFVTVDGHSLPEPLASDSSLRLDPQNFDSSSLPNEKDCIIMNIDSGVFKLDSCFRTPYTALKFVCKKVDDESCPTVDRGYKYMNKSRKCYKINKKPQLWQEAMNTCFVEGGILAVIEGQTQAEEVRDMLEPVVSYFVGVRKLFNRGAYYTVKGKKFSDMYQGQNQRSSNGRYGTVCNRDNKLVNETAESYIRLPFICEMEVATQVEEERSDRVGDLLFIEKQGILPSTMARQLQFYRKDYTFINEFDAFYKVHWGVSGSAWSTALFTCDDEGAILFFPKAQGEWTLVKKLMNKTTEGSNVTDIFVGLHDEVKLQETADGHFVLSNGSLWPQPHPGNCMTMNIDTGSFKISSCLRTPDSALPFVCKKVDDESCPTVDRGYKYAKASKQCYKVNEKPVMWEEAMKTCFLEGGILAIIEDSEQAQDISPMLSSEETSYFIGVRKLNSSGDFYTLKGQKFRGMYRVTYHDENYDCGTVLKNNNSILKDTKNCDETAPFICEMDISRTK